MKNFLLLALLVLVAITVNAQNNANNPTGKWFLTTALQGGLQVGMKSWSTKPQGTATLQIENYLSRIISAYLGGGYASYGLDGADGWCGTVGMHLRLPLSDGYVNFLSKEGVIVGVSSRFTQKLVIPQVSLGYQKVSSRSLWSVSAYYGVIANNEYTRKTYFGSDGTMSEVGVLFRAGIPLTRGQIKKF